MDRLGEESIRVWADGTWQRGDEPAYTFMSDDYAVIYVGEADDDECEAAAQRSIGWPA